MCSEDRGLISREVIFAPLYVVLVRHVAMCYHVEFQRFAVLPQIFPAWWV